jgi:hypothetical protein
MFTCRKEPRSGQATRLVGLLRQADGLFKGKPLPHDAAAAKQATSPASRSGVNFEVVRRHLAALAVGYEFEIHFLALTQITQASALDSADMDESIRSTLVGCDEAEAFLAVEPFDGPSRHEKPFQITIGVLTGEAAGCRISDFRNKLTAASESPDARGRIIWLFHRRERCAPSHVEIQGGKMISAPFSKCNRRDDENSGIG